MTRCDPTGWELRWDEAHVARMRENGWWPDRTMAEDAAVLVDRAPSALMVVDGGRSLSRRDLFEQARRLAAAMRARGLRRGDRISFQLPNWFEAVVIDLAATMAGLVVNPIVAIYREAELEFMLGELGSRLIFIPATFRGHDYSAMLSRVVSKLSHSIVVVVVRGDGGSHIGFDHLMGEGDPAARVEDVNPDDIKLVMYTSGTTGRAKAVLHSHNTIGALARQFADRLTVGENDASLVASPATHISGSILAFQLPWLTGCSAVLMDIWNGEAATALILEHRISVANGAAPFLADIVLAARNKGAPVESLRVFIAGGAAIPETLIRSARTHLPNCVLMRGYGATELPAATLGECDLSQDLNLTTDGRPREVTMRLLDRNGEAVVGEGEGEIAMLGPQMMLGYLRDEDNASAFTDDGFFRSGDLARRIGDDWIVITGRSKDIIIRSGENISPAEIESALFEHPLVSAVAIVGVPDERTGEAACAFVVPSGLELPTLTDLTTYLASRGFARQKFPERLMILPALPMTPAGKVQKHLLRAMVE